MYINKEDTETRHIKLTYEIKHLRKEKNLIWHHQRYRKKIMIEPKEAHTQTKP